MLPSRTFRTTSLHWEKAPSPMINAGRQGSTWLRTPTADPRFAVHGPGVRTQGWVGSQLDSSRGCVFCLVGAERLIAFHHDPAHSDAELDRLYADIASDDIVPAREGQDFEVGRDVA